jgi:hypothetical protein
MRAFACARLRARVCVRASACARLRARVCVHVFACACLRARVCVCIALLQDEEQTVRFVALRTLSAACDRSGSFLLTRMQETLSPTDPSVSLRCVAALPHMRWPAACPILRALRAAMCQQHAYDDGCAGCPAGRRAWTGANRGRSGRRAGGLGGGWAAGFDGCGRCGRLLSCAHSSSTLSLQLIAHASKLRCGHAGRGIPCDTCSSDRGARRACSDARRDGRITG